MTDIGHETPGEVVERGSQIFGVTEDRIDLTPDDARTLADVLLRAADAGSDEATWQASGHLNPLHVVRRGSGMWIVEKPGSNQGGTLAATQAAAIARAKELLHGVGGEAYARRGREDYTGHTRKMSVTLPGDLVEEVRERTGERGFSRYVAEAVIRQVELDKLVELDDALTAEYGSPSDEELAKARAAWPDGGE
jgi:hypothetical protein